MSDRFAAALDDDLNTPEALAALIAEPTVQMAELLGFNLKESEVPDEIVELLRRRTECRAAKDWSAADAVKKEIIARGYEVRDNPDGSSNVVKK